MDRSTRALVAAVPQTGRLTTILLRPERRTTPTRVDRAEVTAGLGLAGDHRTHGRRPDPSARRQVTLLQAEHLPVVAALTGHDEVDPALLRRNLVVAGVNLASLRDRRFAIGEVELEGSGWCHPCSRMEEALGPGGFQAMRGHGGITARVLTSGTVHLGDPVRAVGDPPDGSHPDDH
ncbi:MAG: MOSC domain-containing protein [Nitriliruptoraceae bacterium]